MKRKKLISIFLFFMLFLLSVPFGYAVIKYKIKGIATYTDSGEPVSSGTVTYIIKETGEKNSTDFSDGHFVLDYSVPDELLDKRFTLSIIANTADKISYTQLTLGHGNFAAQKQKCSIKKLRFSGTAIDSNSGKPVSKGVISVNVKEERNATEFSDGFWEIYFSPCLISGELYTFRFTIESEGKRSYLFFNQIAK